MQCTCGSKRWIEEKIVQLIEAPRTPSAPAKGRNQRYQYRCLTCGKIVAAKPGAEFDDDDPRHVHPPRRTTKGL
jgi:hypothetical protein